MFARKDLTVLNSTLVVDPPNERDTKVSLQYLSGGAGTVELQGILSTAAADDVDANWHTITLTKPDLTTVTSLAAAGIGFAENVYARVRAKKTVGAALVNVVVGVTE